MGIVEQYFLQLNMQKQRFFRNVALLTALSLLVVVGVYWSLRQTGIAIANDASCGMEEHQHTEVCVTELALICGFDTEEDFEEPTEIPEEESTEAPEEESTETPTEESTEVPAEESTETPTEEPLPHTHSDECYEVVYLCGLEEHVHEISCYSDATADLEDWDIWADSVPELTGRISEDIVLVAQSQLGCMESELNFEVADDGQTQNGITRYGQWYGNPYGAWSNMFTAFCLRYAGLTDAPINSGAEKMQLEWENLNLYRHAGGYEPVSGDIVFLDKNQNGTVESTAVVVQYFDFILTVIEGDVDNAVVQQEYRIDDPRITGYGITDSAGRLMMFAAADSGTPITIGTTVNYSNQAGTFILYATIGGKSYAIDRNGDAVPITIEGSNIVANVVDPSTLYWTLTGSRNSYNIKTVTQPTKYLNPSNGTLLSDNSQNLTLSASSTGAKFYTGNSTTRGYYLRLTESGFGRVQGQNDGSTIYFGQVPSSVTLWLDGTNGNIISYRGSDNTKYTVYSGIPMQLPSEWPSSTKYQYKLAGWVDIKTGDYYQPGDMITVTENTVLYADWVAATYDIGRYNSHVVDTVSTSDFITTHVFDYSSLINLYSTRVNMTVNANTHSESWTHAETGNAVMGPTMDFSFVEEYYGENGYAGHLGDPSGRGEQGESENVWTGGTAVYPGIVESGVDELVSLLFGTDSSVVGKHYLGQGDHLFQLDTDPQSATYGYYYYDSRLNAASYNQSDQCFYVYDYLALSSDSPDSNEYSDFLPLNSPYANTAGTVSSSVWGSDAGDYAGETYYTYESKYTANNGMTRVDWWLGMRTDISFGLPDDVDSGGNKDLYGNDMHFHFTGDDDVWILIDGEVVLDMGGIHLAAEGDINFSTGEVRVNGELVDTLDIGAGEHTLSVLYLERGASMGNCAMYFNLAPRFSLDLQKEDVLTQELLKGAQFAFYDDPSCAEGTESRLWTSQAAYKEDADGNATNVFTIGEDGTLHVWGLSPSTTYYIKEIKPPESAQGLPEGMEYALTNGLIKLTLDKNGLNSYSATILDDPNADPPISHGFTVHNFRIDEEKQAAYITVTNARNWVTETTSVYVEKKWNDSKDHTYDAVTVYLNVTDSSGTRRIREIQLSKENNWQYSWVNLPKYNYDPVTGEENKTDPVQYSVSEAYVPGYVGSISPINGSSGGNSGSSGGVSGAVTWDESLEFVHGKTYVLKTNKGCLSAVSTTSDKLCFVNEATAKESSLALWTATVSNGLVRLTNQEGQSLNFDRDNGWCFKAARQGSEMNLTPYSEGTGLILTVTNKYDYWTDIIYMSDQLNNDYLNANGSNLVFHPLQMNVIESDEEDDNVTETDNRYRITNTPLTSETSVKVNKEWVHPFDDASSYEKLKITVKLFSRGADGKWVDTGRTETLDLQSGWEAVFQGLPYQDADGNVYEYRIEEVSNDDWIPVYGEVTQISGTNNWQVTLTNHYRWTDAYELPSTGGIGYPLLILCGLPLILAPLVYGLSLRRRYRKGARE